MTTASASSTVNLTLSTKGKSGYIVLDSRCSVLFTANAPSLNDGFKVGGSGGAIYHNWDNDNFYGLLNAFGTAAYRNICMCGHGGFLVVGSNTSTAPSNSAKVQITGGLTVTGTVYPGHVTSLGTIQGATLTDGTATLTAGVFTASTITSTVAIGTAPFAVTSTTNVANLNADTVDGYHLDQDVLTTSTPTFTSVNAGTITSNAADYISVTGTTITTAGASSIIDLTLTTKNKAGSIIFDARSSAFFTTNTPSLGDGFKVGGSSGSIFHNWDNDNYYGLLNAYTPSPSAYRNICICGFGGYLVVGSNTATAPSNSAKVQITGGLTVTGTVYPADVVSSGTVSGTNVCQKRALFDITDGATFTYTTVMNTTGATISSFTKTATGTYALVLSSNFSTIWTVGQVVHATSKVQGRIVSCSVADATATIVVFDVTSAALADTAFFLTIEGK